MTLPPGGDERTPNERLQKPPVLENWALGVGLVILIALLGHLLNQQQASPQLANGGAPVPSLTTPESKIPDHVETPVETKTDVAAHSVTARHLEVPKRSPVMYRVAHKHRLHDCHGTLTFTQKELRFESDQPQDSFVARLDDVIVQGDVLRVRDKTWRFAFADGVSAARVFENWKTGTLRAASRR
jgi:hypothetical protein